MRLYECFNLLRPMARGSLHALLRELDTQMPIREAPLGANESSGCDLRSSGERDSYCMAERGEDLGCHGRKLQTRYQGHNYGGTRVPQAGPRGMVLHLDEFRRGGAGNGDENGHDGGSGSGCDKDCSNAYESGRLRQRLRQR